MPTLAEIMAAKQAAPKITPQSEHASRAALIKDVLDGTAPKPLPPVPHSDQRELGATEKGERIPMVHPPQDAAKDETEWFKALHSFDSDLGIVIDPSNQELAWLAVRPSPTAQPLLLHSFPLINRPAPGQPF